MCGSKCTPRAGAPRAHADEALIEQVILNLLNNARDAMPAGGTIRIHVRPVVLTTQDRGLKPGPYVRLIVEDDGVGMDEVHRPPRLRAFSSPPNP